MGAALNDEAVENLVSQFSSSLDFYRELVPNVGDHEHHVDLKPDASRWPRDFGLSMRSLSARSVARRCA